MGHGLGRAIDSVIKSAIADMTPVDSAAPRLNGILGRRWRSMVCRQHRNGMAVGHDHAPRLSPLSLITLAKSIVLESKTA